MRSRTEPDAGFLRARRAVRGRPLRLDIGLLVVAFAAPASVAAEEASSGEPSAETLLEQARAAMKRRHIPEESARALALYERAIDAGAGYPALWEGARAAADHGASRMPGARNREKRAIFKKGLDWARRATKASPDGAEGHLYLAITLGHHAQSRSFLHQMGIAGELRREAEKAVKLNAAAECGTPLRVLGMYYLKLPDAFGGDNERALKLLEKAVRICPDDVDPHMDYAEALEANGHREEAIKELEWVLAHPPRSAADKVGYRETKAHAEKLLKRWR